MEQWIKTPSRAREGGPYGVAQRTRTNSMPRRPRLGPSLAALLYTLCALSPLGVAAVLPAVAAAAKPPGTIAGTVREGAVAIEHARVCALASQTVTCGLTSSSGSYGLEVPPGKYTVVFTGERCPTSEEECQREWITQYYSGKPSPQGATLVEVKSSTTTGGIDGSLERGGRIVGVVTRAPAGTEPIALTRVCAFPATVNEFKEFFEELFNLAVYCVVTNGEGKYAIGGLAAGEYKVGFTGEVCTNTRCSELDEGETYATQYYNGTQSIAAASHVPVSGSGTAGPVDAIMAQAPPVSAAPPRLSGTAAVGGQLSCSAGRWEGTVARLEYAWLRDGSPIAGQGAAGYSVRAADEGHTLACRVTATNRTAGSASATSNSVAVPLTRIAPTAPAGGGAAGIATVSSVVLKGGNATIVLSCAGSTPCKGTLKLSVRASERRSVLRHGKRRVVTRTRDVTIAETGFAVAAGETYTVSVLLGAKGRALFRKAGRRGLKVTLSGVGVQTSTLAVKESRAGRKGRPHTR